MRGELKSVSSLFDKYKKSLRAPQGSVIKEFIEVVYDLLSIRVMAEKVVYDPVTRVITLRGLGALRSELKLHETEILAHLRARLGEGNVPRRLL